VGARILVAEDDTKQSHLIRVYLEREGHSVYVVGDGRSALEAARERSPDLLVLDVMMPNVDGLDVCRILRVESSVPILLLTARSTEDDILLGLDLGADDYLTKPYSPRELTARVRALLRRSGAAAAGSQATLRVGPLEVDAGAHFATFPLVLAQRMVLAGTPEARWSGCRAAYQRPVKRLGALATRLALLRMCDVDAPSDPGLVLDPFLGSGTTAIAAENLRRDWPGVELNLDYVALAEERIQEACNKRDRSTERKEVA
jgi:CheY-like chemotaxis protein